MDVLSLFDGISCCRVALDRAGIPVKKYSASEIDKYAIKVSNKNYPDIERLGDVTAIKAYPIDLLVGGSPCQDLSIAKKDRKGLEGDRSSLFWEYVRLKNECKPTYFIFENVASMPKESKETITNALGVEPILFNAALVSAQSRKRLFWTNIQFTLPADKGIVLKDILEPNIPTTQREMTAIAQKGKEFIQIGYFGAKNSCGVGGQALRVYTDEAKTPTLGSGGAGLFQIGNTNSQGYRVYSQEGKAICLSANSGGIGSRTGLYCMGRIVGRRLENGVRKDNSDIPIQQRIELRGDDKTGTLTTVQKDNIVVGEGGIRKLTPIECERLQSLPDNYTEGVSNTQRYKCLGNAFNVEVIAHILKGIERKNLP